MRFLSSIRSCPSLLVWILPFGIMLLVSCSEEDCVTCPPPVDPKVTGWFEQDSPTTENLGNMVVLDGQTVLAVGPIGTIVRTGDGGATWNLIPSGTQETLRDLFFWDAEHGWIVGDNGLVLTSADAGLSWSPVSVPTDQTLREVAFTSSSTGYVAGGPINIEPGDPFILKTIDGGASWNSQPMPFTIRTMFFADADSGCGAGGADLVRTTDAGATWTEYDCQPIGWIGCLYFSDTLNGWVSGGAGFMSATRDGGVTWEAQNSGTTRNIVEHFFLDANTGWYVARSPGVIAATTDGGETWRFQTIPGEGVPSDVAFADADTGWVTGLEGLILKTVTGGW